MRHLTSFKEPSKYNGIQLKKKNTIISIVEIILYRYMSKGHKIVY